MVYSMIWTEVEVGVCSCSFSSLSTSQGNLMPSTVCSEPLSSLAPQWKWNCLRRYVPEIGPPVRAGQNKTTDSSEITGDLTSTNSMPVSNLHIITAVRLWHVGTCMVGHCMFLLLTLDNHSVFNLPLVSHPASWKCNTEPLKSPTGGPAELYFFSYLTSYCKICVIPVFHDFINKCVPTS